MIYNDKLHVHSPVSGTKTSLLNHTSIGDTNNNDDNYT